MSHASSAIRGRLIAVDGCDSKLNHSVSISIAQHLEKSGHAAAITQAFSWYAPPSVDPCSSTFERQLHVWAVRAMQLRTEIAPALAAHKYVVANRFNASIYANICESDSDKYLWAELNLRTPHNALPGLTLFLDKDVEHGAEWRRRYLEVFQLQRLSNPAAVIARIYAGDDEDGVSADCLKVVDMYLEAINTLDNEVRMQRLATLILRTNDTLDFAIESNQRSAKPHGVSDHG